MISTAGYLAGCTSDTLDTGDGARTPTATPTENGADRKCHRRQVGGIGGFSVQAPLQRLTEGVLTSPAHDPSQQVTRLQTTVERIARRTERACHTAPVAFLAMRDAVTALDLQRVDEPALRDLVALYEGWTRTLRHAHGMQIIYEANPCEAVRRQVHAHYRVRYRPGPSGKRAGVLLTLDNDWTHRVYLEHAGELKATGMRASPAPRVLRWGASSADSVGTPKPGRRASEMAWPVETRTPWVHLLPTGSIRVLGVRGAIYAEDTAIEPCEIPVKRAPPA